MVKTSNEFTENIVQNKLLCLQTSSLFKNIKNTLIIHNGYEFVDELSWLNVSKLIYNSQGNYKEINEFGKINLYILLLEDIKHLQKILKILVNTQIWNPSAKYIMLFSNDETLTNTFELCWKYLIINVIIILQEKIYTFFPFEKGKYGQTITPKLLFNCRNFTDTYKIIHDQNIFPDKVPLNLQGCQVKFSTITIPPLVINISAPRNEVYQAGLEVLIFHAIIKQMNASEDYHHFPGELWGIRLENNSYTELYGRLQYHEVDILFGYFNAYYEFDLDFDSTIPHLTDVTNFWIPVASQILKWKNISKLFDLELWLLLILLIILNGVVWRLLARRNEKTFFQNFSNCIFTSWYILLQNTLSSPKTLPIRIGYYTWCICSLTLCVAYTSKLISFITNPLFENQIDTMEKLLNSILELDLDPSAIAYLNSNNTVDKIILEKYKLCSNFDECLHKMVVAKIMAVLTNEKTIHYLVDQKFTSTDGKELIIGLKEYGFLDVLRFSTYKGYSLIHRMNKIVVNLHESGLINKWTQDLNLNRRKYSNTTKTPLTMKHLQTSFYILISGYAISFIFLLGEYLHFKYIDNI